MDVRAAAPPSSYIARQFFIEVPAPSPSAVRAREEYHRRRHQLDELERVDTSSEEEEEGEPSSSRSRSDIEDVQSSEADAEEVEELLRGPSRRSVTVEGSNQDATEAQVEDDIVQIEAREDTGMDADGSAHSDGMDAALGELPQEQEEERHPVVHDHEQADLAGSSSSAPTGTAAQVDGATMSDATGHSSNLAGPPSAPYAPLPSEPVSTGSGAVATEVVPDLRVEEAVSGLSLTQQQPLADAVSGMHASVGNADPAGSIDAQQLLGAMQSVEMTSSGASSSLSKNGGRGGSATEPNEIGQGNAEVPRKRLIRAEALAASSSASASPAIESVRGSPASTRSLYETLERLPLDTSISKILNRDLNAEGVYEYIVKLEDGSKYKVNDDLLNQFPDLLDDYDHAIREGQIDSQGFVLDSSDVEMDEGADTGRMRKRRKRTNEDRDSEYDAPGPSGATGAEQDEVVEDDDGQQDRSSDGIGNNVEDEEENASDLEAYGYKKKSARGKGKGRGKGRNGTDAATSDYARRSSREAARKPVNYTMDVDAQESEDESELDDDDEEEQDDSDDMQVDTLARRSSPTASTSRPRQRPPASSDDEDDDDSPFVTSVQSRATKARAQNSRDSEEYDELDSDDKNDGKSKGKGKGKTRELAVEEVHRQDCVKCGASPASDLLAAFRRRKNGGRKKRNPDEELTEEDMLALGAFIECGTCCNVFHFSCLPTDARATSLRTVYKKLLVANHATVDEPKPHLDTERTFMLPSCHVCLKAKGTRCLVCKDEASKKDVTDYIDEVTSKEKEADSTKTGEDSSMQVDGAVEPARVKRSFSPVQETLLFRCQFCKRAAHYSCIPKGQVTVWQYTNDWTCGDCSSWDQPIDAVLAWRRPGTEAGAAGPRSPGKEAPGSPGKKRQLVELPDYKDPTEEAEYLVKFKDQSFRRVFWVPHAWLLAKWPQRLRIFCQKGPTIDIRTESVDHDDEANDGEGAGANDQFTLAPSPNAIDNIPREWLTPDRILEVEYKRSSASLSTRDFIPSANMKARISEDNPEESLDRIGRMYIKWQGLAYEAATWDALPSKDDPQYPAFVKQYAIFLKFHSIKIARPAEKQMGMLDKARPKGQFDPLIAQPDFITNGTLMDFQLEGVSWLYFNWWIKKGCILADEMGLGKTVQIISFLSILFAKEHCLPFLVVVPNSTLANWQREFEKWAPSSMRVVPYYGSLASKRIIEQYELFTEGPVSEQKLRAHVVLTTYESLAKAQSVFKRVPRWEALVVDEAQRLKGGGSGILWKALKGQRIGHTVLLTGTPVNNNLDELFNLLHFIDPKEFEDLDGLHKKYETLTPELVAEVQGMAQPYFLRRTKEAVLDLPPLSEVIVPLGMSVLQKEVYKTVLSKNKDALASIYDSAKAKRAAKANRNKIANVLMELRKTLCHPYLVEEALEHETDVNEADQHRNLVEASSKLTFLMNFIPKLKAKGHRVLLFSQFVIALNVIERFLEGERIKYVRLDGSTAQSVRQENIDRFNAPNSDITVFILSTRAGGVGINLATADTVIIHDADWNPFQDLQAISRAHRIGQKKKVLCFKLMVKDSCEEKIIEKGKKKMVLEQLIVDSLEKKRTGKVGAEEEDTPDNVESLLLFGAKALFEEKPGTSTANNITYSSKALDELLEKTEQEGMSEEAQAEKKQKSAEANKAFSYARVWERTQMEQEEEDERKQMEAQRGFWVKMFEEEQQKQKDEAIAEALAAGRGQRIRKQTNYNALAFGQFEGDDVEVASSAKKGKAQQPIEVDNDPEYQAVDEDAGDSDSEYGGAGDNYAERADTRQEIPELDPAVQAASKYKPNPNKAPPSHQSAQLTPGAMPPVTPRYEIPRSVSPVDVKTRRQDLLTNLVERAKRVDSSEVYKVLQRAVKAPTGTMQLTYMKQASAILRGMDPHTGF